MFLILCPEHLPILHYSARINKLISTYIQEACRDWESAKCELHDYNT